MQQHTTHDPPSRRSEGETWSGAPSLAGGTPPAAHQSFPVSAYGAPAMSLSVDLRHCAAAPATAAAAASQVVLRIPCVEEREKGALEMTE
jgi:hypothetical protein